MNYFNEVNTIHSFYYRLTNQLGIVIVAAALCFPLSNSALAQNMQLVWSDEFDTEELDLTKWSYQYGRGADEGLVRWGNNELQYYTDREENIYIEDGKLHIRALEESMGNANYTSARIRTINKGDWTYGRFEVRAKTPEGQGLWPAIWMMPTESVYGDWPQSGEIDIMELLGHEPNTVYGTVHYGPPWPNNREISGQYPPLSEGTFSDDFHTFAIEWIPGRIRWFVDDQLFAQVFSHQLAPYKWPFDQDFHFILNVAVGGNWPGNPDSSTVFPQEMIVEYVRVYQPEEATSTEIFDGNPDTFKLHQNYPNPFNPSTNLSFDLPEPSVVQVSVYDIMGRKVAEPVNQSFSAGTHTISFDAGNLSSGTYIYRITSGDTQLTKRMLLVK